jgi:DNA-binding MarR family transcriptional regulator
MTAPRLDDQLCFQLYTASRLMTRAYRPLLKRLGITYPQYLALMVLWQWDDEGEPPQPVGALGRRLLLDTGTLTPLLKRLEQAGFVTRTRDSQDERVVRIELTDTGRELSRQAEAVPMELVSRYDGSTTDLSALREAVRRLAAHSRPMGGF